MAIKKLGVDLHGVIDASPELFSDLSKVLVASGWEVHIITGPTYEKSIKEIEKYNICFTNFFSIEDYHKSLGTKITYDNKGNPWMDKNIWDKTKGEYCLREEIDIHIDNTAEYGNYFKTNFLLFKSNP